MAASVPQKKKFQNSNLNAVLGANPKAAPQNFGPSVRSAAAAKPVVKPKGLVALGASLGGGVRKGGALSRLEEKAQGLRQESQKDALAKPEWAVMDFEDLDKTFKTFKTEGDGVEGEAAKDHDGLGPPEGPESGSPGKARPEHAQEDAAMASPSKAKSSRAWADATVEEEDDVWPVGRPHDQGRDDRYQGPPGQPSEVMHRRRGMGPPPEQFPPEPGARPQSRFGAPGSPPFCARDGGPASRTEEGNWGTRMVPHDRAPGGSLAGEPGPPPPANGPGCWGAAVSRSPNFAPRIETRERTMSEEFANSGWRDKKLWSPQQDSGNRPGTAGVAASLRMKVEGDRLERGGRGEAEAPPHAPVRLEQSARAVASDGGPAEKPAAPARPAKAPKPAKPVTLDALDPDSSSESGDEEVPAEYAVLDLKVPRTALVINVSHVLKRLNGCCSLNQLTKALKTFKDNTGVSLEAFLRANPDSFMLEGRIVHLVDRNGEKWRPQAQERPEPSKGRGKAAGKGKEKVKEKGKGGKGGEAPGRSSTRGDDAPAPSRGERRRQKEWDAGRDAGWDAWQDASWKSEGWDSRPARDDGWKSEAGWKQRGNDWQW